MDSDLVGLRTLADAGLCLNDCCDLFIHQADCDKAASTAQPRRRNFLRPHCCSKTFTSPRVGGRGDWGPPRWAESRRILTLDFNAVKTLSRSRVWRGADRYLTSLAGRRENYVLASVDEPTLHPHSPLNMMLRFQRNGVSMVSAQSTCVWQKEPITVFCLDQTIFILAWQRSLAYVWMCVRCRDVGCVMNGTRMQAKWEIHYRPFRHHLVCPWNVRYHFHNCAQGKDEREWLNVTWVCSAGTWVTLYVFIVN